MKREITVVCIFQEGNYKQKYKVAYGRGLVRYYPQYVSRERVHHLMDILGDCKMAVYSNRDHEGKYSFTYEFRKVYENEK